MRTVISRGSVVALITLASLGCSTPQKPSAASGAPVTPAETAAAPPAETAEVARAPAALPGGLAFAVQPGEAQIAIDGREYGTVAELAAGPGLLPLAPGIYQVSLKAAGYVTWRAEVAVRQGTEKIRVTLAKKP